jgi:hypothetical protein
LSPHMHETCSLCSEWSAVAPYHGRQSYACLGSVPHALDCWSDIGWSDSRTEQLLTLTIKHDKKQSFHN